ncbi:MAG: bifunctional precorrin-2 dehydrogenase/sirohydrochlorin ferrochelatase [Deltaproteobacteria bacterium]|nr:bifunctional precorrin-2 dehydrogenase/sirohydrochlorin ferrochelatase [Deltaproteobacteria bacterium]MCB9489184.1 bifunctional precorrin-2 dehydrogenase/sirohydrochlorin ferrochelatase [Deltaproteobacteria bacterium]
MTSLPLILVGSDLRVLVIGGGPVAAEKLRTLLAGGLRPTVMAEKVGDAMRTLIDEHDLECRQRPFRDGDTDGYALTVVASGGDRELAERVRDEVTARGALVNCADFAELGNVHFPATTRRGPLTVSISTGGASATYATWLRERVDATIPDNAELVLGRLARVRGRLKERAAARGVTLRAMMRRFVDNAGFDAIAEPGMTDEEVVGAVDAAWERE